MIPLPSGTKVWLATGHIDMRKGIGGLSLLMQEVLGRDPFCGHLFVFGGRRSELIKIVWRDGMSSLARRSDVRPMPDRLEAIAHFPSVGDP